MMERPNQPPTERSSAWFDQAYASTGFQYSFALSKEERGVRQMVEDVQEEDGGHCFVAELQRERGADHVDFRSWSQVNRDDGRPDLPVETAAGAHFQDYSPRYGAAGGGLEVIVIVRIQTAQKWFASDQARVDRGRFRRIETHTARQRVAEYAAKPADKPSV